MAPVHLLDFSSTIPEARAFDEAVAHLRAGGLLAFPTETVYGLGAHALDEAAVAGIFRAKGRPASNPLIVHVASVEAAQALVTTWPAAAQRLADAFWPGPLTLVLPKASHVPDLVTAGLPAVGIRVPGHPLALALLRQAGVPVAAPSANRYMDVSPTEASHVQRALATSPESILLLDGGACEVGLESTVIDLTGELPRVLRPGGIGIVRLRDCLGEVAELDAQASPGPLPSPGLARRHYAPRAALRLLAQPEELVRVGAACEAQGEVVASIRCGSGDSRPPLHHVLPGEPEGYARLLYATLHALNQTDATIILVQAPPQTAAWSAVQDRLRRAATTL
ncbi:MAG: L-threonylcarbamoyladenylate synthase [Candidatus Sericytochromatia bacterium]|nr:L-threonylcarbamoyladenylate synthase [Candidatus Sericytochromatia bacterium]